MSWRGAEGLAEDVRRYGKWIRDEAEKRLGDSYPKATLPSKHGGGTATVLAWIWARTVTCPNPACGGTMPLVNKFWLGKKKGKERYIVPIVDPATKQVTFDIGGPSGEPREGTVGRSGAVCLICETQVPLTYIRAEGKAKRIGEQMMAIACEGKGRRIYLPADDSHISAASAPKPEDAPESELPEQALGFRVQAYGIDRHSNLFTNRQLTTLGIICDLVNEVRLKIEREANADDDPKREYAGAVATYLAFAASKIADFNSNFCSWMPDPKNEGIRNVFSLQAIPMIWDFAEANPFGNGSGNFLDATVRVARVLELLAPLRSGHAEQRAAQDDQFKGAVLSTDPPYYDNIGYADLSDFFYIWLRRCLSDSYPALLSTLVTPKSAELIATPFRHGGSRSKADDFFRNGLESVFASTARSTLREYPASIYYAFKQSESSDEHGVVSTGWETFLDGVVQSGWQVTATWPMRTERAGRSTSLGTNSLASSVVIAARVRAADAPVLDLRGFRAMLHAELPEALRKMQQANIEPVDMQQAAIGPAIAIYSRYSRITQADGTSMPVRTALGIINEILDDVLDEELGDVDAETRWCVKWAKQHGWNVGPYANAEILFTSTGTSLDGLTHAGVVEGRPGEVRLLTQADLDATYDPSSDVRTTVWESTLHLSKRLKDSGIDSAGAFMLRVDEARIDLDSVKALAYRLYDICERRKWSAWAMPFNELVQTWPELVEAAARARKQEQTAPVSAKQGEFDFAKAADLEEA